MKKTLIIGLLLLAGSWARASITLSENSDFTGGTVFEGNPVGSVFTGNFTAANSGDVVLGMTVTLDISGGYSAGFNIYLVGPDGSTTVTLLEFPGTTTVDANTILTFSDNGSAIPGSGALSSGTYLPQNSDSTVLSSFNGQSANGNWTIYFANLSSGGGNATLNSWNLNIDVVPEPATYALAVFGLVFAGVGIGRFYLRGRRSKTAS